MAQTPHIRYYRGQSMMGTFRPGDCLTVVPVSLAEIRRGDVVVYRGSNGRGQEEDLVHRVLAVVPGGLVTRGDNNSQPDMSLVTSRSLIGRVTNLERNGTIRPVQGGWQGFMRARVLRTWRVVWPLIAPLGRRPYRWLRSRGLARHLWQPAITRLHLVTEDGPVVKYVCSGRTVACWWPAEGRFECRKPYDLVIPRPRDA